MVDYLGCGVYCQELFCDSESVGTEKPSSKIRCAWSVLNLQLSTGDDQGNCSSFTGGRDCTKSREACFSAAESVVCELSFHLDTYLTYLTSRDMTRSDLAGRACPWQFTPFCPCGVNLREVGERKGSGLIKQHCPFCKNRALTILRLSETERLPLLSSSALGELVSSDFIRKKCLLHII